MRIESPHNNLSFPNNHPRISMALRFPSILHQWLNASTCTPSLTCCDHDATRARPWNSSAIGNNSAVFPHIFAPTGQRHPCMTAPFPGNSASHPYFIAFLWSQTSSNSEEWWYYGAILALHQIDHVVALHNLVRIPHCLRDHHHQQWHHHHHHIIRSNSIIIIIITRGGLK